MRQRYIKTSEVKHINYRVTGKRDLLIRPSLLNIVVNKQVVSRGDYMIYPTTSEKAGVLLHAITTHRPFSEGNKQTALVVMSTVCMLNGSRLRMTDDELFDLVLDIDLHELMVADVIERVQFFLTRSSERIRHFLG